MKMPKDPKFLIDMIAFTVGAFFFLIFVPSYPYVFAYFGQWLAQHGLIP